MYYLGLVYYLGLSLRAMPSPLYRKSEPLSIAKSQSDHGQSIFQSEELAEAVSAQLRMRAAKALRASRIAEGNMRGNWPSSMLHLYIHMIKFVIFFKFLNAFFTVSRIRRVRNSQTWLYTNSYRKSCSTASYKARINSVTIDKIFIPCLLSRLLLFKNYKYVHNG